MSESSGFLYVDDSYESYSWMYFADEPIVESYKSYVTPLTQTPNLFHPTPSLHPTLRPPNPPSTPTLPPS